MSSKDAAKHDVWRLFVAIDLPMEVRHRLERIQGDLKAAHWKARWTNSDSAHLTLKFIGNYPVDRIDALSSAVREPLRSVRAFDVSTGPTGAFPNARRPRVIWLGIDDRSGALAKTAASIESAIRALGVEPEERGFRPHLTIARVRPEDAASITDVAAHFAELDRKDRIRFTVDHVTLYRSELGRGGPTYTVVERFELRT